MPTPIATITAAVVVAAGGYGVGSVVLGSGGTSKAAAAKVPALSADPTGRPAHSRFTYQPPTGAQGAVPGLPPVEGQAPGGGAPGGGTGYVPHGRLLPKLGGVASPKAQPTPQTWKLFLSGSDLLQPDQGTAVGTDQSIGPSLGGPCGAGMAGKWTAPATIDVQFHGTTPGLLNVVASGPVTLQIAMTRSTFGGDCTVLSTTTATSPGSSPVQFTLPRVDALIPEGANLSLVVSTSGSARITSSQQAPSYVIAPTTPK